MKVILTEEVVGLGEPGKIVDVAPGYARNFLVPRKLAVYANSGKAKELEHNKRRLERKRLQLQDAAKSIADRINGQTLTIDANVGPGGKLYGSVTTVDIAQAIQDKFDVAVDRRKVHLREPIRTVGDHPVDVQFIGEARATLTIHVAGPDQPVEGTVQPAEAAVAPAPVAAEAVAAEAEEVATEE